jgi:hypothetical protein
MDRDRFDALTRLFGRKGSRRLALGAVLGAGLFGAARGEGAEAKRRKRKGRKGRSRRASNQAIAPRCCGQRTCDLPTKHSDRQECFYVGFDLSGIDAQGTNMSRVDGRDTVFSTASRPSNWSRVSFESACLQASSFVGADLRAANFKLACLVDADLTGARVDASTNFHEAILCRTRVPAGSGLNGNRDCTRPTSCCSTCEESCVSPRVCCRGVCCPELQTCRNGRCSGCSDPSRCFNRCGVITDRCGQRVDCGPCGDIICAVGVCNRNQFCEFTGVPIGDPGPDCEEDGEFCCGVNCCTRADVCAVSTLTCEECIPLNEPCDSSVCPRENPNDCCCQDGIVFCALNQQGQLVCQRTF